MQYYEIHAQPYVFSAIVQTPYEGGTWRIQVGGKHTCVIFNVEQDFRAYLEGVTYYPECSLKNEGKLEHGRGTLKMLKVALQFLFTICPDVQSVVFKDTSSINCSIDDEWERKIYLHMFYVAKHGKTWYEEKLDAKLVKPRHRQTYEHMRNKALGDYREADFDEFKSKYFTEFVMSVLSEPVVDIIRAAYDAHRNYSGMFSDLARNYDCSIFYQWLDKYFRMNLAILFADVEWYIDKSAIDELDMVIKKTRNKPLMRPLPHFGGIAKKEFKITTANIIRKD